MRTNPLLPAPRKQMQMPKPPEINIFKKLAFRASIDMVSSIFVGVGIGYIGDQYWSYGPIGMIMGFMFGAAAGFLNVYKAVKKYTSSPNETISEKY